MTNEEKATELTQSNGLDYLACVEMAEWKDQQFKEFLDNLKEESLSYADQKKAEIGRYVIDVIKGRLNYD